MSVSLAVSRRPVPLHPKQRAPPVPSQPSHSSGSPLLAAANENRTAAAMEPNTMTFCTDGSEEVMGTMSGTDSGPKARVTILPLRLPLGLLRSGAGLPLQQCFGGSRMRPMPPLTLRTIVEPMARDRSCCGRLDSLPSPPQQMPRTIVCKPSKLCPPRTAQVCSTSLLADSFTRSHTVRLLRDARRPSWVGETRMCGQQARGVVLQASAGDPPLRTPDQPG
mmetsp:Transcript_22119/g.61400  ORF Transcript_22119/g.61400 Transcript_22119/m.61400 type:complete len:221 (-) Transcript_22119:24-686(-)